MKKYIDTNIGLSFEYPIDWELEQESNVLSLYNFHNGFGALQFSTYKTNLANNIDISKELNEYLVNNGYKNFSVKKFDTYCYSSAQKKDMAWEYWLFFKNNVLVFISYNCNIADIGKENETVNKIVSSAINQ